MAWWDDILCRFRLARRQPQAARHRWSAFCPVHEAEGSHSPSFSLWLGKQMTALMVGCWAGCDKGQAVKAVGLKMRDLFEPTQRESKETRVARRIVAAYDYLAEDGRLLYQTVRYEPKDFKQRRPDGSGWWVWNLEGVRFVPYRLPYLLARPGQPIVVVEGEKDAEALAALGLEATTGVGGTGRGWLDDYSRLLTGRRFAVVPDQDGPGRAHAERVCGSLMRFGCGGVRWVDLPAPHKDVSDALAAGVDVLGIIRGKEEYRR